MKRQRSTGAKAGFTLLELIIVITVLMLVTALGLGSYGLARASLIMDLQSERLVATLNSLRDQAKTHTDCIGVDFTNDAYPELLRQPYTNPREGCSGDIERTEFPNWSKDVVTSQLSLDGRELSTPLVIFFIPPTGVVRIDPAAQVTTITISLTRYGYVRERTIEIDATTGRIQRLPPSAQ
ncbi:hypothetical protein CO046_04450 [Candidatus Peregrinibacteria bacterium CG_4_9_14_0_2_um_filter_53_11]|nr:MAG: hypothetical protein CO046_04450 [Candidatus Peregrinibacteria bacterium CG_4_9_14_0_2_um_filter_53_11]